MTPIPAETRGVGCPARADSPRIRLEAPRVTPEPRCTVEQSVARQVAWRVSAHSSSRDRQNRAFTSPLVLAKEATLVASKACQSL